MTPANPELTQAFEAQTIDPASFHHNEHIAVAYEMLRKYDFLEASGKYAKSIRAIATRAGAPGKFHLTITLAFLSLIAERMATTEHADYEAFRKRNPDLFSKRVLERLYSDSRIGSDLARTVFLLPDLPGRPA